MTLLETINDAWGWIGLAPCEVLESNAFGNVLVKALDGRVWRICPEDLRADVVAISLVELEKLKRQPEFSEDWSMTAMVDEASEKFGSPCEGRCYCLKVRGVLGGEYGGDNLATISLLELIGSSGDLAQQVSELPDGAEVRLNVDQHHKP